MLKQIEFIKSAYKLSELPKEKLPELVLCGRSNVGKSSFINSLFNKRNVAKTSSVPGKTRSMNYYLIEDLFYIVDLPGFGYAKVSKVERNYWDNILEEYFSSERQIQLSIHLIDSRHEPTALDIQLNNFLRNKNIPYFTILNKSDKLKQSEKAKAIRNSIKIFPELIFGENLYFYSAIDHTGRKEILQLFNKLFVK